MLEDFVNTLGEKFSLGSGTKNTALPSIKKQVTSCTRKIKYSQHTSMATSKPFSISSKKAASILKYLVNVSDEATDLRYAKKALENWGLLETKISFSMKMICIMKEMR